MTTTTLTLPDFLLARIAEDEEAARAADTPASIWRAVNWSRKRVDLIQTMRWSPARVQAECEAKRRIVRDFQEALDIAEEVETMGGEEIRAFVLRDVCLILAALHADHPDYSEAWRVDG